MNIRFVFFILTFILFKTSLSQEITLNEFVNSPFNTKQEIIDLLTRRGYRVLEEKADTNYRTLSLSSKPNMNIEVRTNIVLVDNRKFKTKVGYEVEDNTFVFTFLKYCDNKTFNCDGDIWVRSKYFTHSNRTQFEELSSRLWREEFQTDNNPNNTEFMTHYYIRYAPKDSSTKYFRLKTSTEIKDYWTAFEVELMRTFPPEMRR
jgi:hypothetical protein